MKKLILLLFFGAFLASCGGSHKAVTTSSKTPRTVKKFTHKKTDAIVDYAKSFEGTRYKFGGTTKKGMDCSGLVYTSYKKEGILMPRVSRDMATQGKRVSLNKINKGDLVFFKTNKSSNKINHVGLVVESNRGEVLFIHSTSSLGVIISSLDERYWKNSFVEVRSMF